MAISPTIAQHRSNRRTAGEALFLRGFCTKTSARPGFGYARPVEVVAAYDLGEVRSALATVHERVESGLHAAGFVSYEAGAAFEPAVPRRRLDDLPYVWFALYDTPPRPFTLPHKPFSAKAFSASPALEPRISPAEYAGAMARIRDLIAAGETYQTNFTFPMMGPAVGDGQAQFHRLAQAQRDANYCTFLDIGSHQIASVSPELFFRLDGDRIWTRPMKGTARRHPDPLEDLHSAERLRTCPKERAENLMIVDLLRNDLGRVAETGSVHVDRLFEVERYQTLWTMTSTVSARTRASVPEIFAALFPSGSVTGAPKIRTMQIIHELEREPRGVYCGAIGCLGPGRQAEFNVAIRTLLIDARGHTATYRVGSGITWDSDPAAEYAECLLKAVVVSETRPEFDLLESLRLENGSYWLLDRHVDRLRTSAKYFGYPFDEDEVRAALQTLASNHSTGTHKVRLRLTESGHVRTAIEPLSAPTRWRVALAESPIASQSPFVYNKTTHRAFYDSATAALPDVDDVILWNERSELTESTRANVAVELNGQWLTPPRSAGLLPGVFREELLAASVLRERVLTRADLRAASQVRLINSVRGWIDVDLLD